MPDATVVVVNNTGIDPVVSAAAHARAQAEILRYDAERQAAKVRERIAVLTAQLVESGAAAVAAVAEADRLEALVETEI